MARPTVYVHIADSLRERISGGKLAPGSLLPSEADLCVEYGVTRNTVRRALAELQAERLIAAVPGRGRVVCDASTPTIVELRYKRIAADLRTRIEGGELAPGALLPSEKSLMASYGVARGTARQALADLESVGLVESVQGKGRYVRSD